MLTCGQYVAGNDTKDIIKPVLEPGNKEQIKTELAFKDSYQVVKSHHITS